MDMIKAELAALVAVYDAHRKWTLADKFEALQRAVERARAVLAQPEPAPAADGEVAELAKWLYELAAERTCNRRRGIRPHPSNLTRAAVLLERQALRPISVSERLPEPEDCLPWPGGLNGTRWCWAFTEEYLGVVAWERRPVYCLTTYKPRHTYWLPAHALPLPEGE